jgi:hypothetical protein
MLDTILLIFVILVFLGGIISLIFNSSNWLSYIQLVVSLAALVIALEEKRPAILTRWVSSTKTYVLRTTSFILLIAILTLQGVTAYTIFQSRFSTSGPTPTAAVTQTSVVIPPGNTPIPASTPGHYIAEQQGSNGANTFEKPYTASGKQGHKIPAGAWVLVSCRVYAPSIESAKPDGYWYKIASSPWDNAYYAVANTFMNGDPWGGPYEHYTDYNVPNC